jgi:predicted transcriptional regulator
MQNITLKPERIAALELYAQQHGKEPAEVLDDALAKFLDYETWVSDAVDEGLAAADRGEFVEHEDVRKLIDSRYPS